MCICMGSGDSGVRIVPGSGLHAGIPVRRNVVEKHRGDSRVFARFLLAMPTQFVLRP